MFCLISVTVAIDSWAGCFMTSVLLYGGGVMENGARQEYGTDASLDGSSLCLLACKVQKCPCLCCIALLVATAYFCDVRVRVLFVVLIVGYLIHRVVCVCAWDADSVFS